MKRTPMKRTPMRRTSSLRSTGNLSRGTALPQRSAARDARDAPYPAARLQVFERADGRCEAGAIGGCVGRVQQVHHLGGRVGPDPHRLENLLGVCAPCHDHIHDNPTESFANGWMTRRNGAERA